MSDRIQKQFDKVFEHIETSNREMGQVQADIANIKSEINEIKRIISVNAQKLDKAISSLPVWATIIISILMALLGYFIKT